MLSTFLRIRTRASVAVRAFGRNREYSTSIEATPKPGETSAAPGALRPHLNIPVNPNHGLYAFFRKREKDGKVTHDPFEDDAGLKDVLGRAWSAAELRRKSFRDLHTLWYVLLRERNLIQTQMETYRRWSVAPGIVDGIERRGFQCRKSMARIKYVINERRLAYEGAIKIHAEELESEREAKEETRRREADVARREREAQKVSSSVSEAAQVAVDGLLQGRTT